MVTTNTRNSKIRPNRSFSSYILDERYETISYSYLNQSWYLFSRTFFFEGSFLKLVCCPVHKTDQNNWNINMQCSSFQGPLVFSLHQKGSLKSEKMWKHPFDLINVLENIVHSFTIKYKAVNSSQFWLLDLNRVWY